MGDGRNHPPVRIDPGETDGVLQLETAFVMELLTSVGLRPMLPGATFIVSRAGIVLGAPIPLTLGGLPDAPHLHGHLRPAVPAAVPPVLTLAFTFVFVLDSITYTITGGATLTLALAGSTLVVAVATTPATVTAVVPWWVVLGRVVGAILLGPLLPPYVAIAKIVAAGTERSAGVVNRVRHRDAARRRCDGGSPSPACRLRSGACSGRRVLRPRFPSTTWTFDDSRLARLRGDVPTRGRRVDEPHR